MTDPNRHMMPSEQGNSDDGVNERFASRPESGQDWRMAEADKPPEHPVTTPQGAAGFAVLMGLAGVFAPVFLDARGAISVGILAVGVIGWIYWRECKQAWRERRWHPGLVLPFGFILVVCAITAATALRLAQGGKSENEQANGIADIRRRLDRFPTDTASSAIKVQRLDEIERFIGRPSEVDLSQTFDLEQTFYHNVGMVKDNILHPGRPSRFAKYFVGGQAFIDMRRETRLPNDIKGTNYICASHCIFDLSKKYVENYRRLQQYENDVMVPESVRSALKQFDIQLDDDKMLMSDVINRAYETDRNLIVKFDSLKSPMYLNRILAEYGTHIQNLEAKAALVSSAVKANM